MLNVSVSIELFFLFSMIAFSLLLIQLVSKWVKIMIIVHRMAYVKKEIPSGYKENEKTSW